MNGKIILALLLPLSCQAIEPCTPIRLDSPGGSSEHAPVNLQTTNSCFAYSASTMATAFLHSHGSAPQSFSSSPDAIFSYINASPEKEHYLSADLGRTCNAIKLFKKLGACSNEHVLAAKRSRNLEAAVKEACSKKEDWVPIKEAGDGCNQFGLKQTENAQELAAPEEFAEKLRRHFSIGITALPLAVEYCSGVFSKPEGIFIRKRIFRKNIDYINSSAKKENFEADCGFHASAVIGQKPGPDGQCYYLIHNSWGTSCEKYSEKLECEAGKIWISEATLTRNMIRIVEWED